MSHGDDPVQHAGSKVVMWSAVAATAAEALRQVSAMREQARTARSMWEATEARRQLQDRFRHDRQWWQPVVNPKTYGTSTPYEAALAWASSYAWKDVPEGKLANDRAEERLREFRPDAMAIYDRDVSDGVDPVDAMYRIVPIMERAPAWPMTREWLAVEAQPTVGEPVPAPEGQALTFDEPAPAVTEVVEDEVAFTGSYDGRLLSAVAVAEQFYAKQAPGSWVPDYLEDRGLTPREESQWQIGYAPKGWTNLVDELGARGYSETEMVAAGLASMSSRGNAVDRFRDRAMISVRDVEGHTVGFVGRKHPDNTSTRDPKYLNSPESTIYHKRELLLGLWENREQLNAGAAVMIVEGGFDAMATELATDSKAVGVAPSGTAFTGEQYAELAAAHDVANRSLAVMFDGDERGQRAMLGAFEVLTRAGYVTPMRVPLPAGQDPADMWEHGQGDELAHRITHELRPLADLVVDEKLAPFEGRTQWLETRMNALHSAAPVIAKLPTVDIGQQVWRVSRKLDLPVGTVTDVVTNQISKPATGQFVQKEMGARRQFEQAVSR